MPIKNLPQLTSPSYVVERVTEQRGRIAVEAVEGRWPIVDDDGDRHTVFLASADHEALVVRAGNSIPDNDGSPVVTGNHAHWRKRTRH